ncbi:MAG TPA: four helix bundle protein [Acidimicrobiia bacterium]|nr:four helix bundle protein [Acidimicrobiia bacterium]
MFDYRNLKVWWKARAIVRSVYEVTARYPDTERFGLVSQTRRAALSISANLAEGSGRRGAKEFARFVDISTGSAYELECLLVLANDLDMLPDGELRKAATDLDEVKRMLIGLSRRLRVVKATE